MLEHTAAPKLVCSVVVELRLVESMPTLSEDPQIGRHFVTAADGRAALV